MKDEENMLFAKALTRLRQARKWSRWDLAEKVGVDLRTVEHWEYGECLPYQCYVDKLAYYMPEIVQIYIIVKKSLIRCISITVKLMITCMTHYAN